MEDLDVVQERVILTLRFIREFTASPCPGLKVDMLFTISQFATLLLKQVQTLPVDMDF